jgi:hypothetical protein
MRYLKKLNNSEIINQNLSYSKKTDRGTIREILLNEQNRFCAYSERYVKETDSCHIEHFNPNLKNTVNDDYYNWYAVLGWINEHKAKIIDPYLPILNPAIENISERIYYKDGLFHPVNENDTESKYLIKFLLFNKNELVNDRKRHIARLKDTRNLLGDELFFQKLKKFPEELSFASAIEVELNIDLDEYLN